MTGSSQLLRHGAEALLLRMTAMAYRSRHIVIRMSGLIGELRDAEAGFIALNPSA